MGGVISWFYSAYYSVDQWAYQTWQELVIQEQQHPVILAIALIIVLSLVVSLICNLCSCCWALCCYRPKYPGYHPVYANEKHNYAAIPSATQPPYNPNAPSTSKGYVNPVPVQEV
ncbi:Hypothetical protein NTJ_07929 [Nesidiocoris tenuis]|uniref:Cysteine and tyrosine-rich protein 1 n=1 Tax=Nesidiocoris tenuis TaxID=355587 RepID=A0ABN7ASE1_9HEMI|nr:Hypothetical protein NTJ_07929 [Nesidiocoris tenuis]